MKSENKVFRLLGKGFLSVSSSTVYIILSAVCSMHNITAEKVL